jgi:hypothetical protein
VGVINREEVLRDLLTERGEQGKVGFLRVESHEIAGGKNRLTRRVLSIGQETKQVVSRHRAVSVAKQEQDSDEIIVSE